MSEPFILGQGAAQLLERAPVDARWYLVARRRFPNQSAASSQAAKRI